MGNRGANAGDTADGVMELTERQQDIVDAPGDFLLLACPGSGKTRAAAHRVARLASQPSTKIAVCSYTNVGADRLGAMLTRDLSMILQQQHFLGTIHGFLLRYVVYPYAHAVGALQGPFVRERGSWPDFSVHGEQRQRMTLDQFRFSSDGSLMIAGGKPRGISGTEEEIIASVGDEVRRRKAGIFRKGGALTADDSMYVALKILTKFPLLAEAVAARFDELLLDEAQDTSELQLACLELIQKTGRLTSMVLIGDLEQSIYSFQGASAKRCAALAQTCGLRTEPLSENHRSSQKICDVAVHFCSRDSPDVAIGEHAACDIDPEVVLYPTNDPAVAMSIFRARLQHHQIEQEKAIVLARAWKIVNELNGRTTLFKEHDRQQLVGDLAARLATGTLRAADVRATQRLIAYCAWDTHHLDELDDEQRGGVRSAAYRFLGDLPPLVGDLQSWLRNAAKALHSASTSLTDEVCHTGGRMVPAGPGFKEHEAAHAFAPPELTLTAQTVHSFKGEDSDAVMIVVKRHHGSDPTSQLELWEAAISGADIAAKKEEERRVLFVALTRAARYCLVALPDDERGQAVADKCAGLGFVLTQR
jgi:DNA helicase II / ATP-dependent DNA helicase PcrA